MIEYVFQNWILHKESKLGWINQDDNYEFKDTILIGSNDNIEEMIDVIKEY